MKNQHGGNRPWTDKETLKEAYYRLGKQKLIAEEMGCSKGTIENWFARHEIETFNGHPSRDLYNEEKLRELYEQENSIIRVLERLPNTTSCKAVCDWLDNFGIETNPNHVTEGEKETFECPICEEEFERFLSKVEGKVEKPCCSKKCAAKWVSKRYSGENSPSWKGGYQQNYSGKWRRKRKKVRNRDEVCQRCGKESDRELDVHHIKPVRSFEDPDDAHCLDNLVALCRGCHGKIEPLPESEQRKIVQ